MKESDPPSAFGLASLGLCDDFCTPELSERASIPGRIFPSSSSRDAPPPVETWDTLSSVLKYAGEHAVAVSPPPIIEQHPFAVTATTASMTFFVLQWRIECGCQIRAVVDLPLLKVGKLKDAHWSVPHDGFCPRYSFCKELLRLELNVINVVNVQSAMALPLGQRRVPSIPSLSLALQRPPRTWRLSKSYPPRRSPLGCES